MRRPSIYRYEGRWWHGGFDDHGTTSMWRELWWLLRHGQINACWQWPELVFGLGRDWYDGPIWFVHFGIFSIDLTVADF